MPARVFVDTNVLVYARDASEPRKHERAMAWMSHLWDMRVGRLSFQVLQEFYVTVTDKLTPGLDPETARRDVRLLLSWKPIHVDSRVLEDAWHIQDRHRLSWWDALIVSAARAADCQSLLTEDLGEDQRFGDLRVINPFHVSPETLMA
jgi:predicted nucleic acid-binding protein